ncbi:lytic transglycosylase domain-containing protein [uncultured Pseudoteredinibacter sp.]|uniref:lytic transglycosylase domain-containing protein n=1 Tax=uncultured Pseudoteredinibacter sp. TaxID=1641701 RepID=UPI00262628B6|nr:lytic transglycosylase domain-containing protein [uncultured Pseudoteredinibacter sp.]
MINGQLISTSTIVRHFKSSVALLFLSWLAFSISAFSTAQSLEIDPELRKRLKSSIAAADSFEDRFDAEVWLVSKSQVLKKYIKDPEYRLRVLKAVHREASRQNLPPELVLSVIQIESHFDRFAISKVGAQGMMQVMPFWKKEIGRPQDNLTKMDTNLRYGCTILRHYLDREKGRWPEALARYNGSYGSYRYSRKVLNAWDQWR